MNRPRPLSALRSFWRSGALGGIVLIAAALLAMLLANLPATAQAYHAVLHSEIGPTLSDKLGPMTLHLWINDGLMALFFLLVGLEIKRELVDGQLSRPDRRTLPLVAAAAGMAVPAAVYLLIAGPTAGLARGWAIPAATDIAFAVGILALLGKRVSPGLKIFLTALAIVDDMGAVAIIALAYTDNVDLGALAGAAGVLALMFAFNRGRERRLGPYLACFALLWLLLLRSGVHATIAGVLAAAMIPVARSPGAPDSAVSPLHRLEHALDGWVSYLIVPLFALANAGVALAGMSLDTLTRPLVLGIALGLFLGKQLGVFGAVWVLVRMGWAKRPGSSWAQVYGVSLLAGIGFTMSLFIGQLAFPGDPVLAEEVRLGVLGGSLLAAAAGYLVLRLASPEPKR